MSEMVRVNTRISTEINKWLDEYSAITGVPKSTLIHMALDHYITQKRANNSLDYVVKKLNDIEKQLSSVTRAK